MSELKLLPCPFCGGKATVGANEYYDGANTFYIYCASCGVQQTTTKIRTDEAIAAWNLRVQPANEPLTLDEMNALDHEPIYVLHTGGKWTMNGWHIATASSYQNHGRCDLEIDNGNTTIDTQNYGITWLAYRHKPKEEHHEAD